MVVVSQGAGDLSIYLFQVLRSQYFHKDCAPEIDLSKLHILHTWCTLGSDF